MYFIPPITNIMVFYYGIGFAVKLVLYLLVCNMSWLQSTISEFICLRGLIYSFCLQRGCKHVNFAYSGPDLCTVIVMQMDYSYNNNCYFNHCGILIRKYAVTYCTYVCLNNVFNITSLVRFKQCIWNLRVASTLSLFYLKSSSIDTAGCHNLYTNAKIKSSFPYKYEIIPQ